MRTRSLLTVLACATVLAGAGAETAFADSSTSGQPTAAPSAPGSTPRAVPSAVPSDVRSTNPPTDARSAVPSALPPRTDARGNQITAVPSGAPNTGVPKAASDGHGEAAAIGASLVVLLGGSGTVVYRRRLKGRG